MLVMLPPSEGKATPASGPALDLNALSHGALNPPREEVLQLLMKTCKGPLEGALDVLGISKRLSDEVESNASLTSQHCAPALDVYDGVLFSQLDAIRTLAADRRRAEKRFLIASALWGVVSPADLIPAYRLSISASFPTLGRLAGWWREHLEAALPDTGFMVDLRSGAYASAWPAKDWDVVEVSAARVLPNGERKTISHMAKAARGRVAAALAHSPKAPADATGTAAVVEASGETVELARDPKTGRHNLTVIES